jgi:hypothetical protein
MTVTQLLFHPFKFTTPDCRIGAGHCHPTRWIRLFDLYRLALLIGHICADAVREVGR